MSSGNTEVEDLKELELFTKANAEKEIRDIFARPDDLSRIEQYRRKYAKRKENAEAQLKSAIQNQLDGVRTGLQQLQTSLTELRVAKQEVDEMDRVCGTLVNLNGKFEGLRHENNHYLQLASAIEHLKIISRVPDMAEQCAKEIAACRLLDAHALMHELESCRDSMICDLHRQARIAKQSGSTASGSLGAARPSRISSDERTAIKKYFESVDRMNEDMFKQLRFILETGLNVVRREPHLLVTAVRIIMREEHMDEMWARHFDEYGFKPDSRPKAWRQRAFDVLERTVTTRVSSALLETRAVERMWLTRHLELLRMCVLNDLRIVKFHAVQCFPAALAIFNRYMRWYHDSLSKHLISLIEPTLQQAKRPPTSGLKASTVAGASQPTLKQAAAQNPFETTTTTAANQSSNPFEVEMQAEQGRSKTANPFDETDHNVRDMGASNDNDSLLNTFEIELTWEEIIQLLAFIARYRLREMLGYPSLCTPEELTAIGEVLPVEHIDALEARYIELLGARFSEWLTNALTKESADWFAQQEPAQLNGYFLTDLPPTVIKILQEHYTLVSRMYPAIVPRFAKLCTLALKKFGADFKQKIESYAVTRKNDRTQNKCSAQYYIEYLIAAVNNCDTFAQLSTDLGRQFAETIRELSTDQNASRIAAIISAEAASSSNSSASPRTTAVAIEDLAASSAARMQEIGHSFIEAANQEGVGLLLTDLFADLAAPISKLLSREGWLVRNAGDNRPTEVIFWTLDDFRAVLVRLRPAFYRKVVQSIRAKLVTEYYRALISKKLLFKAYADRKAASEQIEADIKRLEEAIVAFRAEAGDTGGASAAAASSSRGEWEQILALNELLRLEDPGMLPLELATIKQKYPNVSAQDLRNILTMRGDLPNKEINDLVPIK